MGGVIGFSEKSEEVWFIAGWAFRQVLDDVISQYPEDSEMAAEFAKAKALSGLHVDSLEPEFAARIASAIRQVATGILSGTIQSGIHDQPYGDAMTVKQYREGLRQLLEAFPAAWRGERIPE
jgi:hypothetical protein